MKRMNFYINEDNESALRRIVKKTGLTLSDLIRRAIELLRREYEE